MKKPSPPRMAKDMVKPVGDGVICLSDATAVFVEDKRLVARHEHTNHFTNRQPGEKK